MENIMKNLMKSLMKNLKKNLMKNLMRTKKIIDIAVGGIYHLAKLLFEIAFLAYWIGKIGTVSQFWEKLAGQTGWLGTAATKLTDLYQANSSYIPAEFVFFVVTTLFTGKILRIWDGIWRFILDKPHTLFENRNVKRMSFRLLLKESFPSGNEKGLLADGAKTAVYPVGYKEETNDIADDSESGAEFAGKLGVSIHGENVEVSNRSDHNAEKIGLSGDFKRVDTAGGETYMKVITEEHPVPTHSGHHFKLPVRDPFCKTFSGEWKRVEPSQQLWKAVSGLQTQYFLVEPDFGDFRVKCYSDKNVQVIKTKVKDRAPDNWHRPNKLEVTCRIGTEENTTETVFELDYKERYYKIDYDNGDHESKIEPESDSRPCVIIGIFGSVACGKSSFLHALSSTQVHDKCSWFSGCSYGGTQIPAEVIRTMLKDQKCFAFPIVDNQEDQERNTIATLYFLDLAGEITQGTPNNQTDRGNIIESIGRIIDTVIEMCDERTVFNEEREGNMNNVYHFIQNVRKLEELNFVCICTKSDRMQDKMKNAVKYRSESGSRFPLFLNDNPVFQSAYEVARKENLSAETVMYTHMALAKDILSKAEGEGIVHNLKRDKCFIVSAGTSEPAGKGTFRIKSENEINCELPLAYILQMNLGISLKNERSDRT